MYALLTIFSTDSVESNHMWINRHRRCLSDPGQPMGFDFCLLLWMDRANSIRPNQVLARGWAHVGAGGWTWLVEADRFGDFPASRRTREPHPPLATSLRHQLSLDSDPPLLLTSSLHTSPLLYGFLHFFILLAHILSTSFLYGE